MITSVVMTVATDLMIVMATTGKMTDMAVVVATAEMTEMATAGMIEMATTGEMRGGMTRNIVIAVMIGGIICAMTETCSAVMEVVVVAAVAMVVDVHLLALLTPPARFARSMDTLHVIVGGVILIMMMMMMRIALAMRREHMKLIPTCIWTLVLRITSRDN
jgi:hypothetical protein